MKSSICLERQPTPGTESTAVGTTATQSHADGFADRLWREHDVLASQLTRLEAAADAFDNAELSLSALRSELDAAHELLAGQIVPHMRSADDYQRVLAQRDYVSSPAGPEHEEAERLASKLGPLARSDRRRERRGRSARNSPPAARAVCAHPSSFRHSAWSQVMTDRAKPTFASMTTVRSPEVCF